MWNRFQSRTESRFGGRENRDFIVTGPALEKFGRTLIEDEHRERLEAGASIRKRTIGAELVIYLTCHTAMNANLERGFHMQVRTKRGRGPFSRVDR